MRTAVVTLLSLVGLALLGAAAFVYAGFFNVGADDPHSPLVHAVLETARMRSIQTRAAGIVVPGGYDTEENVVSAAGHFAEHCATCHGTPANKPDAFAEGMYRRPPSLTRASEKYTPAELFWIMKHGIKMSGMPAMADDGDPMLWSTVAFVQRIPHLNGRVSMICGARRRHRAAKAVIWARAAWAREVIG